ncbi:MAG TPA: type III restriction endonuclease subunit R [Acidimicrobiaceae bacterium]|nr:type III restriction endonuclease subunit R [Acidimicrobiaceae bacterium]
MKFTLKDYQDEAVLDVLTNLRKAAKRWRNDQDTHAFSLSATTGAGKTVMAAAVFEALFHGDDSYDVEPDPGAVVLWFSDDPSLNEQTRFRLLEASDRINFSDLVVVQNTFNAETFNPGKVYFLNTQKLGKNSLLTRGHDAYEEAAEQGQDTLPEMRPDGRTFTIWDTIRNTIEHPDLTLYLVLDEAHRGMGSGGKAARDARSTIVKRLINGDGTVPPVPIVWGISATVDRFKAAMADAEGRSTLPDVEVDTLAVQESGLLKDTVILDIPDEAGQFDTVLVRRGTDKLRAATEEWTDYAAAQGTETVTPLMVLQVPNKPDPDDLGQALATIFDTWPDLPTDAVAHVLGDHTTQTFGAFNVPYISPERVQESTWVRVLIAKDAISTGWDCPRAEVMVSFRPAKDRTHITQLLGRMVRTPLARRIPGNEKLNAVDCLLPFFDTKTVTSVADALMHGTSGERNDDGPPVRRVLVNPIEVVPNPAITDPVWDRLLSLPSQSLPQRTAKPVKRLTALAHELAVDGLLPDAGKKAHAELHKVLDGAQGRYASEIVAARISVLTVEGKTLTADLHTKTATFDEFVAAADHVVIEDAYRRACRALSPDVARTYAERLADADDDADSTDDALMDAHATVAALGLVPEVKDYLDAEADKLAKQWLTEHRVAIKALTDERQEVYRQLREMSTEPQDLDLAKPTSWLVPTTERHGDTETPLPKYQMHLLADDDGTFPLDRNEWEAEVLDREHSRPGFAGWYRNPSRSSQDSLAIAYEHGGRVRTLRPDFVFFTENDDGSIGASIVDPHGHHLGDALPKLRGLAGYAEQHGHHFQRIDAITKIGDTLRVLDLTEPSVRAAVASATDAAGLYQSNAATDY